MEEITITATPDEWNALIQLIDIALKTQGLGVAVPAAFWHQKIHAAAEGQKTIVLKEDVPETPKEE